MISTVFPTEFSKAIQAAISGPVTLVIVMLLIGLLILVEFAQSTSGGRFKSFARALNVGILPLFITFVLIIFFRFIDLLQ